MKFSPEAWEKLNAEFPSLNLYEKKMERLNHAMEGDQHYVAFRVALIASQKSKFYSKPTLVTGVLKPLSRGAAAIYRPVSRGAARGAEALSLGGMCSSKRSTGRNTTADMKEESGKRVVESKRSRVDNVENFINSSVVVEMAPAAIKSDNNFDSECQIIDEPKVEAVASLKSTDDDYDSDCQIIDEPPAKKVEAVASLKSTDDDYDSDCQIIDEPPAKKVEAVASLKSTDDDYDSDCQIIDEFVPPATASSLMAADEDDEDSECQIVGTKPPPEPVASMKSTGDDDVVEIVPLRDGNNEFDVEKSFSYGAGHVARDAPSSHTPPPQTLSLNNTQLQHYEDVGTLIGQLEGLRIEAPDVKEKDLVKPDEQDKRLEKSIKGIHARGNKWFDPAPYLEQGMSEDHAKRVAVLVGCNPDNQFEIICHKDNSSGLLELKGIKCQRCDLLITSVLTGTERKVSRFMTQHDKAACEGQCEDCGFSRQELYAEYKESLYIHYENTLLPGEPKANRDTFFRVAASRPKISKTKSFIYDEHQVFKMHTLKRKGKSYCSAWFEAKESLKNYIFEFGTDVITEANCDKQGLTQREREKLIKFKSRYYNSNGDGTYGVNTILVRYTGHRRDIICALHSSLEE